LELEPLAQGSQGGLRGEVYAGDLPTAILAELLGGFGGPPLVLLDELLDSGQDGESAWIPLPDALAVSLLSR
jgi:hypothetical protein